MSLSTPLRTASRSVVHGVALADRTQRVTHHLCLITVAPLAVRSRMGSKSADHIDSDGDK